MPRTIAEAWASLGLEGAPVGLVPGSALPRARTDPPPPEAAEGGAAFGQRVLARSGGSAALVLGTRSPHPLAGCNEAWRCLGGETAAGTPAAALWRPRGGGTSEDQEDGVEGRPDSPSPPSPLVAACSGGGGSVSTLAELLAAAAAGAPSSGLVLGPVPAPAAAATGEKGAPMLALERAAGKYFLRCSPLTQGAEGRGVDAILVLVDFLGAVAAPPLGGGGVGVAEEEAAGAAVKAVAVGGAPGEPAAVGTCGGGSGSGGRGGWAMPPLGPKAERDLLLGHEAAGGGGATGCGGGGGGGDKGFPREATPWPPSASLALQVGLGAGPGAGAAVVGGSGGGWFARGRGQAVVPGVPAGAARELGHGTWALQPPHLHHHCCPPSSLAAVAGDGGRVARAVSMEELGGGGGALGHKAAPWGMEGGLPVQGSLAVGLSLPGAGRLGGDALPAAHREGPAYGDLSPLGTPFGWQAGFSDWGAS